MVNLVLNENMKIYRRARTWILVGFMVALVLFVNIIEWHSDGKQSQSEGWQVELQQEKEQRNEILTKPKLAEESRIYNLQRIALIDYHLEKNIPTSRLARCGMALTVRPLWCS